MRIGGYLIIVEPEGRQVHAIDSLGVPSEGRELELWGQVFVVTRVRHREDPEERSTTLYTHPMVYIRLVGTTPTDPRPNDKGEHGATVLPFEEIPDGDITDGDAALDNLIPIASYRGTDADELAEERARIAHEMQCAMDERSAAAAAGRVPRTVVRRADASPANPVALPERTDRVSTWWASQQQKKTSVDVFATARAAAGEQRQVETRRDVLAQSRATSVELAENAICQSPHLATAVDDLAADRALLAHQLQQLPPAETHTSLPALDDAAPRTVVRDDHTPHKTILPWSSR